MKYTKNQIVAITRRWSNGNATRLIGVISQIHKETTKGLSVTLLPVNPTLAAEIRKTHLTKEFNHQGIKNCYSDTYGFACNHVHKNTTKVIGKSCTATLP